MQQEGINAGRDRAIERNRRRGKKDLEMGEQIFDDWRNCDGYVNSVETALMALALSCVSSIILILFIEKVKLLFYQNSEQKYEQEDLSQNRGKFLQTKNLAKTYKGNVKAVKGISFDLSSNREILGLLGSNGAGKSSTFNMVTMQI